VTRRNKHNTKHGAILAFCGSDARNNMAVARLFERKGKATDRTKTPEEKNAKEEADRWD
jgi:hypothetical protein